MQPRDFEIVSDTALIDTDNGEMEFTLAIEADNETISDYLQVAYDWETEFRALPDDSRKELDFSLTVKINLLEVIGGVIEFDSYGKEVTTSNPVMSIDRKDHYDIIKSDLIKALAAVNNIIFE